MRKLVHSMLLLAILMGTASSSSAIIHKIKCPEIPALRKMKAEHRAKKEAKKMRAKKSLFGWVSGFCDACKCAGGYDCECDECCSE